MAREFGIYKAPANYEPQIGGPFDARMLVGTKSDLMNPATWRQTNGDIWVYVGMIVAVSADTNPANNGIYILTGSNYTLEESWEKQATASEIADLQQQIDNIEISGDGNLDITVKTETDLPAIGDENTTYYVEENASIQRWDADTQDYIKYGGSGEIPDLDINIIHGGNANGSN